MTNLSNIFKTQDKKVFYTILAAGVLAAVSVVGYVSANGPTFNIFPIAYNGAVNTDYPLLDARNFTKGEGWSTSQSDHDAGISANPGDVIEFLVYYHNGAPTAPENIAYDVVVKANLPGVTANNFNVGASISASNAQTVSSATKGGDIKVAVSGPVGQTLTLVPGSTVWLPNRATSQQTMPDTITTSGVNLGSIQACWDFTGFVKFKVKVSENQPNLGVKIVKTVKNVTDNTIYWPFIDADPDDVVEFKLEGTNTGQATLDQMIFSDNLPSRLSFIANSIVVTRNGQNIPFSGGLFNGGLTVGNIAVGQTVNVEFKARVASVENFSFGTTELTNVGFLRGTLSNLSVGPVQDTAIVKVFRPEPQACTILVRATFNGGAWSGPLNYSITGPQNLNGSSVPFDLSSVTPGTYSASYISGGPASANFTGVTPPSGNCPNGGFLTFTFNFTRQDVFDLTIEKTVRNLSAGSQFADSTGASPSQTVEFKIVIKNVGNTTMNNVISRDVLPAKLTYVNGSLTVNGASVSCQSCFFNSTGINLGNMVVNETKTIVFASTVAGQNEFPVGNTILTNTGYAKADSVAEKSDTASVTVTKEEPQKEDGNGGNRPS